MQTFVAVTVYISIEMYDILAKLNKRTILNVLLFFHDILAEYVGKCARYLHKIDWRHGFEYTRVILKVNAISVDLSIAPIHAI